jgi:hypothetical protein
MQYHGVFPALLSFSKFPPAAWDREIAVVFHALSANKLNVITTHSLD